MANATSTQLQELYVAYFGRAADPTGLDYWKARGITTAAFAANMYAQPEFNSSYGSLTTESQVNQIYKNLFDREADVTGLTYWTQEIKLGNLQLAEIANHLIWAAQNNSGSADDKKALTNRAEAAVAYTAKIKESTAGILAYQPLHNGLGTEDFSAGINITEAVSYLSGIDKDTASTAAGIATSVAKITDNGVPSPNAKTYTLTSNTDNLTGSTGKDVYQGVYDGTGSGLGTTATSGDSMIGGTGVDTFNLSITGDPTASKIISGINADVEKILISNYDSGDQTNEDHTFDASLSDGVTTVGLSSSNAIGDTIFTNLKALANAEMTNGAGDLTVTHIDSVVSGTADSLTLTVSGQSAGKFTETSATAGGVETINVVSKGSANDVDVTSGRNIATTVNISGDQNLTTILASSALKTVDASSFTGKLDVTHGVGNDLTITGGSGDDTITFSGGNFTSADIVDGGAGTDVLAINGAIAAATDLKNVSNVETLRVLTADSVTIAADANVMNFDLSSGANANTLTLSAGVAGAVTATVGSTGDTVTNNANVGLTVKGTHTAITAVAVTGGTGTDTIEVTGDDINETTTINLSSGGSSTGVEKILVVDHGDKTSGTDSSTNPRSGRDVHITTGSYATALTVDASALDAANVDTDSNGTINSSDNSEEKLTFVGSGATKVLTVTGGAGADAITTGTKNDIIDGGAGADTITSSGGNDNIKGGAGNDTFVFTTTLTKDDVIDGGDGTDTLSVTALDAVSLVGVTNVETLSFSGSATVSSDLSFDTIDISSATGDAVTFATGYTKATTVKVAAGDSVINSAKLNLTVTGLATNFETADSTIVTGSSTATNDSVSITADGSTVDTRSLITNVNTITVVDGGDSITGVESSTNNLSGDDFTINLTSYATALTLDASALDAANKDDNGGDGKITEADASAEKLVITGASSKALTATGGGSNDTIVGSSDSAAGDTLKGGDGADTFSMGVGNLTYLDTIDGGAGTDIITVAQDVSDVDFMNVTNIETLTIDENGTSINTLGAYVNNSGLATVNLDPTHAATIRANGTSGNINYVVTNSVTDTLEDVQAGLGDDTLTVTGTVQLKANDTFNGGAGTDTVLINNSGAATIIANLANITNVEKIVVKDNDGGDTVGSEDADAISITIDGAGSGLGTDNGVDNADVALEIDASVITDSNDAVTYILSDIGDKDYSFTVKDGAGNADYTGSGVVDTVFGYAGDDVISTGAGDDVVDGGTGADTITGGTGQDTLTGGAGKDIFKFALGSSETTTAKPDTITDFSTGNDTVRISLTTAGSTYDFTNKGTATDASSTIEKLSSVKGQYVFNTTKNSVVLDADGNGLIQAGDYEVKLTGITSLADADIAFDIQTATGTADTITTGNANDTIVLHKADDAVTAGKGDDIVTLDLTYASATVIAGGEGTDTIAVTANTDLTGYTTEVTGFEKITLAAHQDIILSPETAATFASATAPTVTGTGVASSANEVFIVTLNGHATAGQTLDLSPITFGTDANIKMIGGNQADLMTASGSDDYMDGATGADIMLGKAGNDSYDLGDVATVDTLVETADQGTDTIIMEEKTYTGIKIGTTKDNGIAGAAFANFEQIALGDDDDVTLLAAQLSGQTIAIGTEGDNSNLVTLNYTATTAQTVDLGAVTGANISYTTTTGLTTTTTKAFGSHGTDKMLHDPGDLRDTITLSPTAGIIDVINVGTTDGTYQAWDIITNFNPAKDSFVMPVVGTTVTAEAADADAAVIGSTIGSIIATAKGKLTAHSSTDATGTAITIDTADELTHMLAHIHATAHLAGTAKTMYFDTSLAASTGAVSTFVVQGHAQAAKAMYVELVGVTGITDLHGTAAANKIGIAAA